MGNDTTYILRIYVELEAQPISNRGRAKIRKENKGKQQAK
jgi:hypothetical protein